MKRSDRDEEVYPVIKEPRLAVKSYERLRLQRPIVAGMCRR